MATAEVVEAQAINCVAPFILCSKLQPLLAKAAQLRGRAFVVNVPPWRQVLPVQDAEPPAHEHGQGVVEHDDADLRRGPRFKTTNLHATAADTGWINDLEPGPQGVPHAHGFQTPIDEVDAAARILHPISQWARLRDAFVRCVFPEGLWGDGWYRLTCHIVAIPCRLGRVRAAP